MIHGYFPKGLLLLTIVPIPKNRNKALNTSDNYRGITLSSLLCKLFEICILKSFDYELGCDDCQFAYKSQTSTTMCTWAAKETISYFNNRETDVYACFLDCSKAFDRVNFKILFEKLLSKNLPPIVVRSLLHMYENSFTHVRWGSEYSMSFNPTNGVKQGAVTSPIFFNIYLEELVTTLRSSSLGCHINGINHGVLVYADDVLLLSPSISGLQEMLDICQSYALKHSLTFNDTKSECVHFANSHTDLQPEVNLHLGRSSIKWTSETVRHLGHHFSNSLNFDPDIAFRKGRFWSAVNIINNEFRFAHPVCKMRLLNIYASNFYGSNLWDFRGKAFESICKAWNIAIRSLFRLDRKTHCRYLPKISKSPPLLPMLCNRFKRFIFGLNTLQNVIIQNLVSISKSDQRSPTNININFVDNFDNSTSISDDNASDFESDLISQLIEVREGTLSMDGFDADEVRLMMTLLSTG